MAMVLSMVLWHAEYSTRLRLSKTNETDTDDYIDAGDDQLLEFLSSSKKYQNK